MGLDNPNHMIEDFEEDITTIISTVMNRAILVVASINAVVSEVKVFNEVVSNMQVFNVVVSTLKEEVFKNKITPATMDQVKMLNKHQKETISRDFTD